MDQLSKFIAMCRPSKSSSDEANKEQHSIPEIFECLYLFSTFYLQIYLEKTIVFWITAHILVYALVLLCQMVCLKMIQNCKVGTCPTPVIIGHKTISRWSTLKWNSLGMSWSAANPSCMGGAVEVIQHHSSPVPGVAHEAVVAAAVPPKGEAEVRQFQCLSPSLGISNMWPL